MREQRLQSYHVVNILVERLTLLWTHFPVLYFLLYLCCLWYSATFLWGSIRVSVRILWLVDRKPYDGEDIFRGIIVESRRGLRCRSQQAERIEEGFVNLLCSKTKIAPTRRLLGGSRPVFSGPVALSLGILTTVSSIILQEKSSLKRCSTWWPKSGSRREEF